MPSVAETAAAAAAAVGAHSTMRGAVPPQTLETINFQLLALDAEARPSPAQCLAINAEYTSPNTTPAELRESIDAATTGGNLITVVVTTGGTTRLYYQPRKWRRMAGEPESPEDGLMIAYAGDIQEGIYQMAVLPNDLFTRVSNGADFRVPTPATISAGLTANANVPYMGPYAENDEGTEVIQGVRYATYVPKKYEPLFEAGAKRSGGLNWHYYFGTIYPAVCQKGDQVMMLSVTNYFQMAATAAQPGANQVSLVEADAPAPISINHLLMKRAKVWLVELFAKHLNSGQDRDARTATHVQELVRMAERHHEENLLLKKEERDKKRDIVKQLGLPAVTALKRLYNVETVQELVDSCPFLQDYVEATAGQRVQILQARIDEAARAARVVNPKIMIVVPPSVQRRIVTGDWSMNDDVAGTGSMGNFFLFGPPHSDQRRLLDTVEEARAGNQSITMAEAQALVIAKTKMPGRSESLIYVRNGLFVYRALLQRDHPALVWLEAHYEAMRDAGELFTSYHFENSNLNPYLGVYHVLWISITLSNFFLGLAHEDYEPLPSPRYILKQIEKHERWHPAASPSFFTENQLAVPGAPPAAPARAPAAIVHQPEPQPQPQGAAPPANPPAVGASTRVRNERFSQLFERFRVLPVKCADLRRKVQNNALPALPLSRVDGLPMCLAYHTKGVCCESCPRKPDHVAYEDTTPQYVELCGWCNANYES